MLWDLVLNFYQRSRVENHRFKSWEHCYKYYYNDPLHDKEKAALHLDSYLASWGMKRGSTRLILKDFRIHDDVIELVVDHRYSHLRGLSLADALN